MGSSVDYGLQAPGKGRQNDRRSADQNLSSLKGLCERQTRGPHDESWGYFRPPKGLNGRPRRAWVREDNSFLWHRGLFSHPDPAFVPSQIEVGWCSRVTGNKVEAGEHANGGVENVGVGFHVIPLGR
jgi:hypothetical protein